MVCQQHPLLMEILITQCLSIFSRVKHLYCCLKLLEIQQFCPYLQYIHGMASAWFSVHISTILYLSNVSTSSVFSNTSTGDSSGVHRSSCWTCEMWHGASIKVSVTSSLLLFLLLPSRWAEICTSVSRRVTEPRLWRCWCQLSLLWSGCSGLQDDPVVGAASAAGAREGHRHQGSKQGASEGWWSPWWSGRLCSWSCRCHRFSG